MKLKSFLFFIGLTIGFLQTGFAAVDPDSKLTHEQALKILNIENQQVNESLEEFKKRAKKAYFALSNQYHPDKNKDAGASEIFKTLKPAFDFLTQETQQPMHSANTPDDIIKGTFSIFLSELIKKNKQTIFYLTSGNIEQDIVFTQDHITEEQINYLQNHFMQDENKTPIMDWIDELLAYLNQEELLTLFYKVQYEKDDDTNTILTSILMLNNQEILKKILNYPIDLNLNVSLKHRIQFPDVPVLTTNLTPLAFAIIINAPKEITSLLIEYGALLGDIDKTILPYILPCLVIHGQHEMLKDLLKSGMPSSLGLCSVLFLNILLKQLIEEKEALEKQVKENPHDAILYFKLENIKEQINQLLSNPQIQPLLSQEGSAQEFSELLILSATPTKSTMRPYNFIITAGCIIKDLFDFKTERTKKRKEKTEEKERQEKEELEVKMMKQLMLINSNVEEDLKEIGQQEELIIKERRSPIKQLQHFVQKYGQDIKKNPRKHAILACTLIPWVLQYTCWR